MILLTSHLPGVDDIGASTLRRDVDAEGTTSGTNLSILEAREHWVN